MAHVITTDIDGNCSVAEFEVVDHARKHYERARSAANIVSGQMQIGACEISSFKRKE